MKEVWVTVNDYPDYMVSNLGNVKKLNYRKSGKEKILKHIEDRYGYMTVNLYKNNKLKHFTIHKLVATHFINNPENKPQVNHIDGNKKNNRLDNLEWVTNKENMRHAWDNGLIKAPMTGKKHSNETKKKISLSKIGKYVGENSYNYGRKHSQETKANMKKAQMELASRRNSPMKGKKHTEESKKKISENHADFSKGKHPRARKVRCITTGEVFDCITDATYKYNTWRTTIAKSCRDKNKSSGIHPQTKEKLYWEYID